MPSMLTFIHTPVRCPRLPRFWCCMARAEMRTICCPSHAGAGAGGCVLSPRGAGLLKRGWLFFLRGCRQMFSMRRKFVRAPLHWRSGFGAAVAEYKLDASKVFALGGFSNGASIAASVMLLHPGVLAGALLLRPRTIVEPSPLPDLKGAPVLVLSGLKDEKMPQGSGEHLARLLGRAGAAVEMGMVDAGHDLTPSDFGAGKSWFGRVIR